MKKAFYSFCIILMAAGFASCNKDYTCACTFTDTSKNFEVKLEKMRKNDASTVCQDYSVYVGNCAIK